jgi:hypothetical protein
MTSQRFPLRQIEAAISRLGRRLDKPSAGAMLASISSLVQVLAVVFGGAFVLLKYFSFEQKSGELTLQQGQLAIVQGQLAARTAEITLVLNKLQLERATEDRSEAVMDSSAVRLKSARFDDGTFLHRYYVSLKVKNISDSTVFIPAIVAEFFIGTMPKDELEPNKALHINLPTQWLEDPVPGGITWAKEGRYAHSQIESPVDYKVKEVIQGFDPLAVDFGGSIRSGATTDIGLTFLIRSRPDTIAGAVITYWDRTATSSPRSHIYTNIELLSEAEDAPALKTDASVSKGADREEKPK